MIPVITETLGTVTSILEKGFQIPGTTSESSFSC